MSIKLKSELLSAITNYIRVGGQPAKTKATDVRALLADVVDTLFSRAKTVNGTAPDPETGNISLTGIPTEVHQQFVVNPNLDTTDIVYLESGPVTFRVSYDENKINGLNFRIRKKGEMAWSAAVTLAVLNSPAYVGSFPANQKYEVQLVPTFTAAANAAGEDVLGLLIY